MKWSHFGRAATNSRSRQYTPLFFIICMALLRERHLSQRKMSPAFASQHALFMPAKERCEYLPHFREYLYIIRQDFLDFELWCLEQGLIERDTLMITGAGGICFEFPRIQGANRRKQTNFSMSGKKPANIETESFDMLSISAIAEQSTHSRKNARVHRHCCWLDNLRRIF